MDRKSGESIQEFVSRIRQDAVKCDFSSITYPLDKALQTRFICSINNKVVPKVLFKNKDSDLTFTRKIKISTEIKDAAKVANICA